MFWLKNISDQYFLFAPVAANSLLLEYPYMCMLYMQELHFISVHAV